MNLKNRRVNQSSNHRVQSKWFNVGEQSLHSLFIQNNSISKTSIPVVLVSGLGISSSYMIPAARELAFDSDVYCPDLPGFGKSSKPYHTLNITELAQTLSSFLQNSGIKRAVIAGHSFGCQIAAEFALQNPEKIERLILAAPSGDPRVNSAFRYLGRLALDAPREPISLTPLAIRDYLTAGILRGYQTLRFALQDRIEDKLSLIAAPTLVIRGSRDPIVSADWTQQVTRLLPNAKLVTIETAAHAVNYNSPQKFAKVIREFIKPI